MSTPMFLVASDELDGTEVVLHGAESHHLRVRRLRSGSPVVLADGRGRQRLGMVVATTSRAAIVRFTDAPSSGVESPCHITLAQAALKADKLDLIVEKATELGVSAIVIYACQRSLGSVSEARRDRWQRIARSAAKQCGRATSPTISGPTPAEAVFASSAPPLRLLFLEAAAADRAPSPEDLRSFSAPAAVTTIVGPEGGFTPEEVRRALHLGCTPVTLGTRILRAETAAIAALTLCQFLWGDLGRRPG